VAKKNSYLINFSDEPNRMWFLKRLRESYDEYEFVSNSICIIHTIDTIKGVEKIFSKRRQPNMCTIQFINKV